MCGQEGGHWNGIEVGIRDDCVLCERHFPRINMWDNYRKGEKKERTKGLVQKNGF
jgi:hypothetical protein